MTESTSTEAAVIPDGAPEVNTKPADSQHLHQQTEAQLEAIAQEIRESQALTSELQDLTNVLPANRVGVDSLCDSYVQIRTVRGDGNCYYRAFLYRLCEGLLQDRDERHRILQLVQDSKSFVTNVGDYEEMAIEIFYDTLVEFLQELSDAPSLHSELTQETGTSDYGTWYLRVLTATFLKADPGRFLPYLEDGYVDIDSFCQAQVEPMGKECSMVQVLALAEYFQVSVLIEYLDGRELSNNDGKLAQHQFGPPDSKSKLHLLYRPGHYDILYQKTNE